MEATNYDGPRPPVRQKRVDIVRIKDTTPSSYVILSERPYSIMYHWIANRSRPCKRSTGECEGCAIGMDEKWSAYLHVVLLGSDTELFLELTDACISKIFTLANDRPTLRGSIVKLSKTKGGVRGRYVVDLLERVLPSETLPDSRKPDDLLKKLWAAKK